ncbi:nicotinate-nucleotide--dimethylbenzimidazole phosphoribosyltransferase [Desulfurivibrio dismutans]|uniref:nicotinate-nucleotide--dimethylbenzimidazole phosphoribosyltransferase n=1 Tax=Desulfurivibrio dismutans TaxID=1398908 RepID=UPI0023DB1A24|nr:nicotinate-nucleotide--dimethylbenzimidazole phosphoribosyltransferase [Desulfurivibrio alkaliphilus]MDF1615013.1 nicotinate-nucleotide--dimethylbenzimidazole phosphoribosyltransferase [Desulfurivibrio alkaliphilus]
MSNTTENQPIVKPANFTAEDLAALCRSITPADAAIREQAQARLDNLTKPQGSLGKLEMLAARSCAITGQLDCRLQRKTILTFAADHGVTAEGISKFPPEVTIQMIHNFLGGGAGVNVLARHVGAEVRVIDVGAAGEVSAPGLISRKVRPGTANIARGPAMSQAEALAAIKVGIDTAREAIADGAEILGTGEMGIGNTTPSAALFAALLPVPVNLVTGLGTGIEQEARQHKVEVIEQALKVNHAHLAQPLPALAAVGGLEIAAICGVILEAAQSRVPVVVDGFISSAGALVAMRLAPVVVDYCFFSHMSAEQGHKIFFQEMQLEPLLHLDLRLGEGTGAALAMGLVDAGLKIMHEMATFGEAGVSRG